MFSSIWLYNMELKLFVFIVLYQILISGVFGEIKLDFTDFVGTVTPVKPNATAILNGECKLPSLPKDTNLSELVLEYFNSQFPELAKKSPIVCTFSSPLLVTSISKPVSLSEIKSKFEDTDIENLPVIPDDGVENNVLVTNTPFKRVLPIIPFTITIPNTPQHPPEEHLTDVYQNEVPSCPERYDTYVSSPIPQVISSIEDYIPPINVMDREYLNQPLTDPNNIIMMPTCNDNYQQYSSSIVSSSPCNIDSYCIDPYPVDPCPIDPYPNPTEPLCPLSYPLQYTPLTSPEGLTSFDLENSNPNTYQELDSFTAQQFVPQNLYSDRILPLFVKLRDLPSFTPQLYPCNTPDRSYSVKIEPFPSDLLTNEYACNYPNNMPRYNTIQCENPIFPFADREYVEPPEIEQVYCESDPRAHDFESTLNNLKNLNIDFENLSRDCVPDILPSVDNYGNRIDYNIDNRILDSQANVNTYSNVPEFYDSVPDIPTVPEICIDIVPDAYIEPVVSNLIDTTSSRIESSYVNTASYPSCDTSPVVTPPIDNTILDVARSISSHFMSYLDAKSGKEKCDPLAAIRFKSDVNPDPNPSCIDINPTIPKKVTSEHHDLISNIPDYISPSTGPKSTTKSSPHDATSGDNKFNLLKVISSAVSKSPDLPIKIDISSAMSEDVSVNPSSSIGHSKSQECSCSSSAAASSSNVEISLPGELKTHVTKLKSLKHKPKTFKKLLELIFLAELLNDDEDIDWEAIDTVLDLLSITF